MTLDASASALLVGLNPAQLDAATHPAGPILIVAGPGSGKTRVIAHRIAWLVREQGVQPWQILAVTFTKKAAHELRDRVAALIGGEIEGMSLGTFHSTCARMLRVDGVAIDVPREFVIYDDADQDLVIRRALADLGVDPKQYGPRAIRSGISRFKSDGVSVEDAKNRVSNYFDEVVARLYERYDAVLRENGALDFDDLLSKTVEMFEQNAAVAERYQRRYRHVLVDEFQDTKPGAVRPHPAMGGGQQQSDRRWRIRISPSIPGGPLTSVTSSTSSATIPTPRSCASSRITARRRRSCGWPMP